jgi:hypothetical protein
LLLPLLLPLPLPLPLLFPLPLPLPLPFRISRGLQPPERLSPQKGALALARPTSTTPKSLLDITHYASYSS